MKRIFFYSICKSKKLKIFLVLTIFVLGIFSFPSFFHRNTKSKESPIYHKDNDDPDYFKREENESKLKTSESVEWEIEPNLDKTYFSPNITPGEGDEVIHYFSVDQDANYTLNISKYYDPIDNYPGSSLYAKDLGAAYLMPGGTWLVVLQDFKVINMKARKFLMIGIGNNASNLEWSEVGEFNETSDLVVAGNETGHIYITYIEKTGVGSKSFTGINYFCSEDWGQSWYNGTLANYTQYEDPKFHGLSIAEFNGNFTCMWSFVNGDEDNESKICISSLNSSYEWEKPKNFTAIEDQYGINPQIFFNQTNNNGTFYLAFNNFTGKDGKGNNLQQIVITRFDNGISNNISDVWNITTPTYQTEIYCTKDYSTEKFYFLKNEFNEYYEGIQNATWGQNLNSRSKDTFNAELDKGYFNLFAKEGPKCFATYATSEIGESVPGILNSDPPFSVIELNKTAEGLNTQTYIFNGSDEEGIFREAEVYSFDLCVESQPGDLERNLFVYVDRIPANYQIDKSINHISPFSSLDINDKFLINIKSNKPGSMKLNIKSTKLMNQTSNITAGIYQVSSPMLCGDGINNFLFYEQKRGKNDFYLMVSKSLDGGLFWEEPKEIVNSDGSLDPKAVKINGTNIYLWTDNNKFFMSTDLGENFIYMGKQNNEIIDVTNDLVCWYGGNNGTDKFSINMSNNLGNEWIEFCNFALEDADNYTLQSVAYDPVSGNYSFLLTHEMEKILIFYTISNDGKNISSSNNLLIDGGTFMNSYRLMVQIDVRKTFSGLNEWIITSSAVNSVDYDSFSSKIAYCTSTDGIQFSSWENFTEITGKSMNAIYIDDWDIIFLDEGAACFASSVFLGDEFRQIMISSSSNFIFGKSKYLDLNYNGEISFDGITNEGEILPDDTYNWELVLTDQSGTRYSETGIVILDNTNPSLTDSKVITSPNKPFPKDNVSVTIPIYEINPDYGRLYYRDPVGEWQEKLMKMDLSSYPYVDFSATIPSHPDNVSTVFWKAVIYDTCGNSLVVDNNGQLYSYSRGIFEYIKQTGKLNPTLYDDWNWTYIFTSGADHLDEVWIHKSLEGDNGMEEKDIILSPIDTYNTTYSINIKHDLDHLNGTYIFMFCSDEGDNYTVEEIKLKKPSIRIEQENEHTSLIDLSEVSSYNVSFKIPEYTEYINHLFIEYEYDNGEGKKTKNMTKSGDVYTFSFKNFPKNATQVNYTVSAVDIFRNNVTWDQHQSIKLLPALPEWEMSAEFQAIVALSSLIIGIGCAVVYSSTMGSETHNPIEDKLGIKYKQENGELKTKNRVEQETSLIIGKLTSISKKGLMIGTLTSLFAVATILAIVSIFALKSPEIAMLLFTGGFLSMVTTWVLLFGHFTEKTFRSNQLKLPISYKITLLGISIIIYVVLFSIFLVGNLIPWWRVRVNDLSYNIAGILIPRALTTVTTAFFSSILLLTWSTLKELSIKTEEFFESIELNENPLKIAKRKEKSINSIINSIGKKGILFVTIIGVVIIFASDLSIYANQGMLIVIPFALGALLTLFVYSVKRKKEEPSTQKKLIDNTMICAKCGEITALSGTYCENCGNKLLSGERSSEGIICENCEKMNIKGGTFCRYCGSEIKEEFNQSETKESSESLTEKETKSK